LANRFWVSRARHKSDFNGKNNQQGINVHLVKPPKRAHALQSLRPPYRKRLSKPVIYASVSDMLRRPDVIREVGGT